MAAPTDMRRKDRIDAYLVLIESERASRPSEALLADEIKQLREALDAAVSNSTIFMVRLQRADPPDYYYELGWKRHAFAYDVLHGIEDHDHERAVKP